MRSERYNSGRSCPRLSSTSNVLCTCFMVLIACCQCVLTRNTTICHFFLLRQQACPQCSDFSTVFPDRTVPPACAPVGGSPGCIPYDPANEGACQWVNGGRARRGDDNSTKPLLDRDVIAQFIEEKEDQYLRGRHI